ncbi:hypothetical protein Ccrd_009925 [Cynara cardunculus var. scolymus]|uniref:Uncharacterized protein n=1 Tax=Cynara cardunculus var. scolymus TaxID=59895 RepID=A0A103YMC2_CYNCS|nr:hypothetical protein Ccrd_009925 [Cynara cardunculus var. scolymus]
MVKLRGRMSKRMHKGRRLNLIEEIKYRSGYPTSKDVISRSLRHPDILMYLAVKEIPKLFPAQMLITLCKLAASIPLMTFFSRQRPSEIS